MWLFGKQKKQKAPTRRPVQVKSAWDASQIDRLLSGWSTGTTPINAQIESELRNLRSRSRQLAKNDPYLRRFFQLCRSNIVGHKGFSLSSDVRKRTKGNEADRFVQEIIEKAWKEFSRPEIPCSKGKLSLIDIQNLFVDQLFRDGEVIVKISIGDPIDKFGISYAFIDPELMDVNLRARAGNNSVRMGIETNSKGRVVAYHFNSTDATHLNHYTVEGRGYIRIEKKFIIHKFFSEYVDQLRGYPQGASAMLRMRHLNGYEEAELVAARVGSSTMGFIERGENGEGFKGGVITDDEGNPIEEADEEIETVPASWNYIDKGASIHTFDPNHPTTAYKDYVKGVLRGIASGLGVDYNTLANDLEGVNFSSLRAGVLESRELWKCFQDYMITHFMDDIFERWIDSSLLVGALKMPNGKPLSSSQKDRYKNHHFQGRRWAWVDPKKDIETATIAVNERFRSRSDIIREQGGDPDQVWEEIAKENEKLLQMGIVPVSNEAVESEVLEDEDQESNATQD